MLYTQYVINSHKKYMLHNLDNNYNLFTNFK